MKKFKMPTLFYERMSSNSDIDAEFKTSDPEELKPANALVLTAQESFDPKANVEITEDNKELVEFIKGASTAKTKYDDLITKKNAEKDQEKIKKLDEEIEKLKEELEKLKVTQLDLLHAFAKIKLGNKSKPGTFIKGKYSIGTHIVQFNASMTTCFLWGSITNHVTIKPDEVLKQLPFVKDVNTSYL